MSRSSRSGSCSPSPVTFSRYSAATMSATVRPSGVHARGRAQRRPPKDVSVTLAPVMAPLLPVTIAR